MNVLVGVVYTTEERAVAELWLADRLSRRNMELGGTNKRSQ